MVGAVMVFLSLQRDVDVADGCGHADLHVLVVGGGNRSGDQVLHHAAGLAAGAAVADAHAASAFGREPGVLGLLQPRPAVIGGMNVAFSEGDPAASSFGGNGE